MSDTKEVTSESVDDSELKELHQLREQYMRDLRKDESLALTFDQFKSWWTNIEDNGLKKVLEAKFRKGCKQEVAEGAVEVHKVFQGRG